MGEKTTLEILGILFIFHYSRTGGPSPITVWDNIPALTKATGLTNEEIEKAYRELQTRSVDMVFEKKDRTLIGFTNS